MHKQFTLQKRSFIVFVDKVLFSFFFLNQQNRFLSKILCHTSYEPFNIYSHLHIFIYIYVLIYKKKSEKNREQKFFFFFFKERKGSNIWQLIFRSFTLLTFISAVAVYLHEQATRDWLGLKNRSGFSVFPLYHHFTLQQWASKLTM